MEREQLPKHVSPTYVLPDHKAVYIATSKAACTSLKWLVADLQGEDPLAFAPAVSRMVSPDLCIHHRGLFKHTPVLHDYPGLAEIDPANGWFVFTVVRHPAARMFSAWQSKLLLREPRMVDKHIASPFFPRVPRSSDDIVADFRMFVLAMAADPQQRLMKNRHFLPQWREAAPGRVPYSKVYDTSEIPLLLEDLRAHIGEELPRLRESNETPLKPIRALFDDDVQAAIADLYREDFEHLGYEGAVPPRLLDAEAYSSAAVAEVQRIIERHERIKVLADAAEGLQAELKVARSETAAARRRAVAAEHRPPTAAKKLRRAAGRARRRLT